MYDKKTTISKSTHQGTCSFFARIPVSPDRPERGEGGTRALFARTRNVVSFIGVGVHKFHRTKCFGKRNKKCPNIIRICPSIAPKSPIFCRIRYIGKMGGGGTDRSIPAPSPPPPPVRPPSHTPMTKKNGKKKKGQRKRKCFP